jgi:hypothetical protein
MRKHLNPLRLCSAIPENRSFFGRFFSLTTACFFVRSLVSFLSDAGDVGDVGDAGVWLRLRRAKSWRETLSLRLCMRFMVLRLGVAFSKNMRAYFDSVHKILIWISSRRS